MVKITKPKINDRTKQAMGAGSYGAFGWRPLSQIQYIVWHYTAVPRSYGRFISQHEDYWRSTHGWDIGGYHFYIDSKGEIWQNYSLHVPTYGVAGVNPVCVHISVEANSKNDYSQAQINARQSLTLWLMSELGLGGNSLRGHKEFKGHESNGCPGYTVSELATFRAKFTQLLKGVDTQAINPKVSDRDVPIPAYKAPTKPFDKLNVGDTVKIREGFSFWYNPNNVSVGVKPSKNFVGTTDVIKSVIDCNIGYSKRAYLLRGYNSFILEQDLVEARKSWVDESKKDVETTNKKEDEVVIKVEDTPPAKNDGPAQKPANYLYFEGKYYEVGKAI